MCVIDELTVFKGLSGDEASSINNWLSTTLAATPLKFIKSVGLIHNYVTTHANLCSLHGLILYSCLVVRQVPCNAPRVLGSREL